MKYRWLSVACVASVAGVGLGCGKTEYKDSPQTVAEMAQLKELSQNKDELIAQLEKRITDLEAAASGIVTVNVEGSALTISKVSGKGPNARAKFPKGDARDRELYEAFLQASRKSKGRVQQCYQNALKKNSALQARTIELKFSIEYRTDGKVKSSQFNPRLSGGFDECMDRVASSWNLPAMPKPVTFASKLTLTPE